MDGGWFSSLEVGAMAGRDDREKGERREEEIMEVRDDYSKEIRGSLGGAEGYLRISRAGI